MLKDMKRNMVDYRRMMQKLKSRRDEEGIRRYGELR